MLRRVALLGELVAFKHTVFSASFVLVSMVVSSNAYNSHGFFGFEAMLLASLALVCARNCAMSFNRICDLRIDSSNDRTKGRPSVDGRLSYSSMVCFCALNALGFVFVSYLINHLAFLLSFPFLFVLCFYSYVKRFSSLSHFVLGLSLGLAPISGDIVVSGSIHVWSVFLCIGVMLWASGFDILYSLQDVEHDRSLGLFSIPSRYGVDNAILASKLSHLGALLFWALFLRFSDTGPFAIAGLLASALMLAYEHHLVQSDFGNIPKAFFTANGYLGFLFLAFVVVDSAVRY